MKIKSPITLAALLLALLASGCHHDTFTIRGTLEGGANKTIWLEELSPEGPIFIDSIHLDKNGSFKYRCKMPYQSLYNLHTSADHYIVTLPNYGEKITVNGKWENLQLTYKVEGSPESALLWQLQQYTNDGTKILYDLVDTFNHYDAMLQGGVIAQETFNAKKEITDSIYRAAYLEQQEYICRFIDENQGSLATLIALYKPFNNHDLIDLRNPDNIAYYDKVMEGLQNKCPDNPHTLHFKNTLEHLRSALARRQENENTPQATLTVQ